MIYWIKKLARMLGWSTFFLIFLTNLNPDNLLDHAIVMGAIFKGIAGACLFWFVGYIIGDVVFKGVIEDIKSDNIDLIDGGILQRIGESQKENIGLSFEVSEAKEDKKKD